MPLEAPLTLEGGARYTVTFQNNGATLAAIWTYPLKDPAPRPRFIESPGTVRGNVGIDLGFIPAGSPTPVHVSRAMTIYELANVRPYAAAPGCEVDTRSHDEIWTSCATASQLTRLTVFMTGWRARVDDIDVPIGLAENTFQVVALPAGTSRVTFHYAPPGFELALAAASAAFVLVVLGFAAALRRRQNSADAAAALP